MSSATWASLSGFLRNEENWRRAPEIISSSRKMLLLFSSRGEAASASPSPLVLGSHWDQGSQSRGEGSLTAEQRRITKGVLRISRRIACSGTTSRTSSAVSMPLTGYGWVWGVKRLLNLGLQDTFTPGNLALDFRALIHVQLLEREPWEEWRNWQLLEYSTHCDQQQWRAGGSFTL